MDVLRPPIINISGICYRKNTGGDSFITEEEQDDFRDYEDEDPYGDEVCDAFSPIEQTDSGWQLPIDIPNAYFKFIIGKKGETRRRLENETGTQLHIPKHGDEGPVVIIGREKKGVASARSRINILVESARQKQPFTHFLSFPITSPTVREGFLSFKEAVLRSCDGDRGLDETIFQNVNKLHFTIGTLPLMNEAEISMATDLLQQCQQELVEPIVGGRGGRGLHVQVKGLEYMNDDPNAVDVLYAKVHMQDDDDDRLQMLADRLVDKFSATGLMHREWGRDRVKLHITVMNSLMRKDPSGVVVREASTTGRRPAPTKDRESFDASNVLKKFGAYDFGAYDLSTVHLSQRYSRGPDGYYACAASIHLL